MASEPTDRWTVGQKFNGELGTQMLLSHVCISFPIKCGSADAFEMYTFSSLQVTYFCTHICMNEFHEELPPTELIIIYYFVFWQIGKLIGLKTFQFRE